MRYFLYIFLIVTSISVFAEPSTNVWAPAAKSICDQLQKATTAYQQGDLKNARLTAVMAYFKGYDTDIEPAVRVTLGGPHVFAIERQFRDFSNIMTPHPDKKQIKKVNDAATQLCQAVNEDANALNAANIQRQVFKVE